MRRDKFPLPRVMTTLPQLAKLNNHKELMMLQSEIAPVFGRGATLSKMEKYGWIVKDAPGFYAVIPKETLLVEGGEHGYQRKMVDVKAVAIAREWSWVGCGCLIVGKRSDGTLYVIDGQHRLAAAMKRSDIRNLPCLVFEVDDIRVEADGFLNANVNRKPLSSMDRFNALLIRRDPAAVAVQLFAEQAGRTVRTGADAGSIECVGTLMKCWTEDQRAFDAITPLVIELCRGTLIQQDLIAGLHHIERKMATSGASLAESFWTKRVLAVGCDELLLRGRRMREALGKGGTVVTAKGFVAAITARIRRTLPGFEAASE